MNFNHASTSRRVDLDGMTVMTELAPNDSALDMPLGLSNVPAIPEESSSHEEGSLLDAPDSPITAAFAPFMSEIFGPGWRCPSPVVLHIGDPSRPSSPTNALCPIWKKSNELFGKVFSYRPGSATLNADSVEAGLLYLGIKTGWSSFSDWMQSPALRILKEVDEFLFCHLPRMQRLAVAYKSFKLLSSSVRMVLVSGNADLRRRVLS
jgi:hypothetical protein